MRVLKIGVEFKSAVRAKCGIARMPRRPAIAA